MTTTGECVRRFRALRSPSQLQAQIALDGFLLLAVDIENIAPRAEDSGPIGKHGDDTATKCHIRDPHESAFAAEQIIRRSRVVWSKNPTVEVYPTPSDRKWHTHIDWRLRALHSRNTCLVNDRQVLSPTLATARPETSDPASDASFRCENSESTLTKATAKNA